MSRLDARSYWIGVVAGHLGATLGYLLAGQL